VAKSSDPASHQVSRQLTDAERLRHDYEARLTAERPISHSVKVAYRQLIARCERRKRDQKH
jgi:hypothetical protein